MGRQLVVLALVFAGVVCHAYAAANSTFAPMPSDGADASSPGADDTVGEIDAAPGDAPPGDALAGPVGGPVIPNGAFGAPPEAPDLSGGAAASVTVYSAFVAIGGVVAGYLLLLSK